MKQEKIDRDGEVGLAQAEPRSPRRKLLFAIMGMILAIVFAVGLVLQEQGQIVRVDPQGHLYSPFIRQIVGHKESKPSAASPGDSLIGTKSSGAPSED
ncbi:MAG TPA: hypothetical protein VMD75_00560 [Candidatus Binataceae bacterium]|nr:hypothetical protein [Candidatus Binataceae bacterium]